MPLYQGQNSPPLHSRRKERDYTKTITITIILLVMLSFFAVAGFFLYQLATLPKIDKLADYRPPTVSQVFGDGGTLVGEYYLERRIVVPVDKIPKRLIQAFVAAEDSNFFKHAGLDYLGIVRAAFKNLITLKKKEGASTITQQVAKSMLLTPEKKFSRKIKEAILATRMEKMLSKDDILYIYLNQIYLGGGAYGVQIAAETYFAKNVDQLNLAEISMLAGLPKAPNTYSPIKHFDRAKERQSYVLDRMVKEGYVTQAEADHARNTPITVHPMKKVNSEQSAYFLEQVRIYLEEKYGEERLYKQGLKVYTTMNAEMQRGAHEAVTSGLKALDKRQGFRGPLQFLQESEIEAFCKKIEDGIDSAQLKQGATYQGVVTGVKTATGDVQLRIGDRSGTMPRNNYSWAGKLTLLERYGRPDSSRIRSSLPLGSVIDVQVMAPDNNKTGALLSLEQSPDVQSALVAVDPRSGAVKALVGGYDFKKSQFNRAVQARRNPGSAFKPIIYGAALDKGVTSAAIFDDAPVEYESGQEKAWKPKNYDNIYRGPVTMREALTNSINVVSVKILETIGVGHAVEFAKRLGIVSPLETNLTLALGSSSLTPLELTTAYAAYANGGYRVTPFFLTKVTDAEGNVLEEIRMPEIPKPVFDNLTTTVNLNQAADQQNHPATLTSGPLTPVPAASPEVSFIITSLMQSVVTSGTGRRASALGRPVAGKTGTTNDMKDAWFVGFVPQLAAGVWVGFDQERSLGSSGSGGQAAAPIWTEFMQKALWGIPVQDFPVPSGVTSATINIRTGKLAREGSENSSREWFIAGTEPTSYDNE